LKVRHIAQKRAAPGVGGAAKKKRARALLILWGFNAVCIDTATHETGFRIGYCALLCALFHTRDDDGVAVLKTEVAARAVKVVRRGEDGCHSGILRM